MKLLNEGIPVVDDFSIRLVDSEGTFVHNFRIPHHVAAKLTLEENRWVLELCNQKAHQYCVVARFNVYLMYGIFTGISFKTQELYALVFATRYLDIFIDFISLYNTVMKLIFFGSSFSIVWYIIRHKIVRRSYDKDQDTFRHHFLILPCLFLALCIHERFTFKEVMWTFSLYLEVVAILPQLILLQRTKNIDNLTEQYVFLLGWWQHSATLASYEQQDAHEFFISMLDRIHEKEQPNHSNKGIDSLCYH
ncbi:ER lumen protein-retaining receptor-like [Asparagus officinalis]|uniref:ER lumen protein-retaining receptor-like n=1 Tax=Asparagus officinalis TaxID=4686 RepID=UPI00098E2B5F|nr:ER lumen protein-retaining receptor-like [Asparagus officinalis]